MKPLISIVIPAYNAALYIENTLTSIIKQEFKNFEVLIINDGSIDETLKLVQTISSKDSRIKVKSIQNSGVSIARNEGLKAVNTLYVLFLDADDLISPNFLQSRIDFLEENQEYSICGSEIFTFNSTNTSPTSTMHAPNENGLLDLLLYKNSIASIPSNLIFRTETLIKNKVWFRSNLSSTADKFFLIELFNKGILSKNIENSPLFYRVHENSMSQKISLNLYNDNLTFFKLLLKESLVPNSIKLEMKIKNYYILTGLTKKLNLLHFTFFYGLKYSFFSSLLFCKRRLYK